MFPKGHARCTKPGKPLIVDSKIYIRLAFKELGRPHRRHFEFELGPVLLGTAFMPSICTVRCPLAPGIPNCYSRGSVWG